MTHRTRATRDMKTSTDIHTHHVAIPNDLDLVDLNSLVALYKLTVGEDVSPVM